MDTIFIKKVANGYTVEISGHYDFDRDEELYLYKTREEMEADLTNVIERAHQLDAEDKAKKAAKKSESSE